MATGAMAAITAGGQLYSGYEQQKEARKQAREISEEAGLIAEQRRKQTEQTVQRQKMAFIKSGITLSPDSPLLMLADTREKGYEEASRIQEKGDKQAKVLRRQGRQAFIGSVLGAAGTGASAFGGAK